MRTQLSGKIPEDADKTGLRPAYYREFYFTSQVFRLSIAAENQARQQSECSILLDHRYPEAVRITAPMGAEILFYPAAIPGWAGITRRRDEYWKSTWRPATIQRARAVANGTPECETGWGWLTHGACTSGVVLFVSKSRFGNHSTRLATRCRESGSFNWNSDLSKLTATALTGHFMRQEDRFPQPITKRFIDEE